MAAPREGPNPLRPYYIPPSIGTASGSLSSSSGNIPNTGARGTSPSGFSFSDLDYFDYMPDSSPPVSGSVKDLIDKAAWKYASVLMAQPFEVAKLILQVHVAQDEQDTRSVSEKDRPYEYQDDEHVDSSDEEPNFFTSSTSPGWDSSLSPARDRSGRPLRQAHDRKHQLSPASPKSPAGHRLPIKNPHSLIDALSSLTSSSGILSLWRATNTTFVYTILHRTLETFFRSFLATILGAPEADILGPSSVGALPSTSILTSTAPLASLLIATASSTLSAILLSPIDTARTRLILTPASLSPRSLLSTIKTLPSPSYLISPHLIPITFFSSTIPGLISLSTPLVLKNHLNIDPVLNPHSWSMATFAISAMDLVFRHPFETVLRRAQIATWTAPPGTPPVPSSRKAIETIVPVPQSYRGIIPTAWAIVKEEGTSVSKKEKVAAATGKHQRRPRKGQGVEGLYRGWRVGMWGLVGIWGAHFVGGMQSGVEVAAEGISVHGKKF